MEKSSLKKPATRLEENLFDDDNDVVGGVERSVDRKEKTLKQNGEKLANKKTKDTTIVANGMDATDKRDKRAREKKNKESSDVGPMADRKKKEKKQKEKNGGEADDDVMVARKEKKKKVDSLPDLGDEEMAGNKKPTTTTNPRTKNEKMTSIKSVKTNLSEITSKSKAGNVKKENVISNGGDQSGKGLLQPKALNGDTIDGGIEDEESRSKNDSNSTLVAQNNDLPPVETRSSKKGKKTEAGDKQLTRGRLLSDNTAGKKLKNGRENSRSISPSKDKKKAQSVGDEFDMLEGPSPRSKKNLKEKETDEMGKKKKMSNNNGGGGKEKVAPKVEDDKLEEANVDNDDAEEVKPVLSKQKKTLLMNDGEDDDVFLVDNLPMYAKAYILPRVMNKESVDARMKRDELAGGQARPENEEEDRNLEAFKFSMLKASLDYESGCVGAAPVPAKPSKLRRKKKSSTGSADKSDEVSGRTSSMSHTTSTHAMSVKRSRKISSSGGQNCIGPGSIADYVSYVKSGGFVPLPVLEPERGVESALFAQYPGLDALDEDGIFTSGKAHNWRQKPNTLDEVNLTIDDQFDKIREKFGEPTIVIRDVYYKTFLQ